MSSGPEELLRREESSPLEESPTRDDASHREDVELVPATTARVSPSQMRTYSQATSVFSRLSAVVFGLALILLKGENVMIFVIIIGTLRRRHVD